MKNVKILDLRGVPLSVEQVNDILRHLPDLEKFYTDLSVYSYELRDQNHHVGKVYYYNGE